MSVPFVPQKKSKANRPTGDSSAKERTRPKLKWVARLFVAGTLFGDSRGQLPILRVPWVPEEVFLRENAKRFSGKSWTSSGVSFF